MSMVTFEKRDMICEKTQAVFSIARLASFDKVAIITKAMNQALLKSQHTNDGDQNNSKRTSSEKFNKQFQGIFAEIVVLEYLKTIFSNTDISVLRYDDVRIDEFKSPKNEYDLMLTRNGNNRELEVRSSISYKNEMSYNNLRNFHVIGPYVNKAKKYESLNNYYIRPIFQLKAPNQSINLSSLDMFKLIMDDQIDFYITGGCTKKMMANSSEIIKMGQKNTEYNAISVLNSLDIVELNKIFRKLKN